MSKILVACGVLAMFVAAVISWQRAHRPVASSVVSFPVTQSDQEWRDRLPGPVYQVLRQAATEPPNSSPLNHEKRQGTFLCAGCQAVLFGSADKYDSGTGFPSFIRPASKEVIGTKIDYKMVVPRTEVHCSNCGGHLGHVFNDGPAPTGKRYCMNGLALDFVPSDELKTPVPSPSVSL